MKFLTFIAVLQVNFGAILAFNCQFGRKLALLILIAEHELLSFLSNVITNHCWDCLDFGAEQCKKLRFSGIWKFSLNRDLRFEKHFQSCLSTTNITKMHKSPFLGPKCVSCPIVIWDIGYGWTDLVNWMKSAFFCGDDTIENVVKLAIMPLSLWGHSLCRCLLNQLMMELVRPSASCRRHPSVSTTKERERAALSIHEMES